MNSKYYLRLRVLGFMEVLLALYRQCRVEGLSIIPVYSIPMFPTKKQEEGFRI